MDLRAYAFHPRVDLTKTKRKNTLFLAMKLTAVLLLAGLLQVSATGWSQTVTLSEKNVPVQQVFKEISRQTGISILYNEKLFEGFALISIELKDATIQQAMDQCLKNQPLTYTIENNKILIKQNTATKQPAEMISPPIDIQGRITDSLGNPLAGASITVKGTKKGTSTDANGNFTITSVNDNATLVISYTGYTTKKYKLEGSSAISVFLSKTNSPLDEVQIIAYGTTTKRLNTGDASTVTAETIEKQPVSNPLAALEGQVSGLDVTQATGVPGGNFTVQIRGQNNLSSSNNPFYIVDGVPYNSNSLLSDATAYMIIRSGSPFNYIPPSEIESIVILKDADATAIYGSRGANGVILITTKKGKQGSTKLDVNLYAGAGKITRTMPLLNTPQYVEMRQQAFVNDGVTPDNFNAYDLTIWDTTSYTDWERILIGNTAHLYNATVNLSGGSANTQFSVGMGYNKETTVFPGDMADKKVSANFNITHTSTNQKFKAFISGNFLSDNNNLMQFDFTSSALTTPPNAPPIYDSLGKLNWGTPSAVFGNPYSELLRRYSASANNLIGNAVLQYQIIPGLLVKLNAGYTQTLITDNLYVPLSSLPPFYGFTTGSSEFGNNSIKTWIVEPQLEYQRSEGPHHFSVLIGATFQQSIQQGQMLYATGYTNEALMENIAGASDISVLESSYAQYRYEAFFARLNYDWQSKYIVNLTGRRDGSSRFGPGKQFANFGAIGLAWIFTKEDFVRDNLSFLTFGKIRGSYGITGNDQIGNYQYLSTYASTPYPYQQTAGIFPAQISNPDYGWETNKKSEIALELGFVKDRILFTTTLYHNISSNQLVGYSLPMITGFGSVIANLPATVLNTGVEFELHTNNISTKDFVWTSVINLTIPHNELQSYPGLAGSPYANVYTVGKSLYTKKLYHSTGVDPQSGVYTFEDVNHDGQITYPDDLTSYKQVAKTWYAGFQNSFSYKGWQLDVFFQFVNQTGFNYLYQTYTAPGIMSNQPTQVLSRWQKPGDLAPVERYTQDFASNAYTQFSNESYVGDGTIVDASYIRLKNLALSWSLPESWNRKIHFQSAKLYFQCQNLLTITGYEGMDPENQSVTYLPPLRMITFGIQFTF